jgi:hypothetical protein
MDEDETKYIELRHESHGRVRLRLPWLRKDHEQARALADRLQDLPGLIRIEVRPYTGSLLFEFDPDDLDAQKVLAHVTEATGVSVMVGRGQAHPRNHQRARAAHVHGSRLARSIAQFFKELDADILTLTDGDLGLTDTIVLALGISGIRQIFKHGQIHTPPWYGLAWRAVQVYSSFERPALEEIKHPFDMAQEE